MPRKSWNWFGTCSVASTLGIISMLASGCAHPGAKADFYVAPNGNDAWSGKLPAANALKTDGAFATLQRARDAVRELKGLGNHDGPIVVMVRGGTFFISEPLTLGPEDSGTPRCPIIYRAYPGERVVLSGGRPITGWRKNEGDIWVADVPRAKGNDGWDFRQLFVGGERRTRARTPNFDPNQPITGGWSFVQPFEEPVKGKGRFGETLVNIHTPGDTFEWYIDVPADGQYALWLYYGAKNEPFGRKTMAGRTQIQIDGGDPVVLQNLPDTAGWGTFKWAKTASVELTNGKRRLRWTNVQGGGLNLDTLLLTDAPEYAPGGTKIAAPPKGSHLILVQAETFTTAKAKEFRVNKPGPVYHKDRFTFRQGDIKPWPRSPEPEIHIFPAWGWVNAILSLAKVDHEKRIAYVTNRNCTQELRPGNRYFIENVYEALDTPGEWFLDRGEGKLYYRPKSLRFAVEGVVAPVLDRIIDIAGDEPGDRPSGVHDKTAAADSTSQAGTRYAEHIVIRGMTFRHTTYSLEMGSVYSPDDGAIWLRRARHCVIEDCTFEGVGGYAVRLQTHAHDNAILHNAVVEAGQGGILMIGYDSATQPRNNLVAGNLIHHCGRIWKHVAGIYVTTGGGNRIAHNAITDVPRYGISLKTFGRGQASHDNIVEYNRIVRTNMETNDTGAIETLGRDREDSGNVIRYNLILDAVGLKTSPTGEMMTPFYTWGIYLDDYSSGTTIYSNIVARNYRGGLHIHLGRNNVVMNNIFVDGRNQQAEYNGHDFMANNVFARNIVVYRTGTIHKTNRWHDKILAVCENNLYWQVDGDLRASNAAVTPLGSLAKWREAGYDTTSLVLDPLFVDAANNDYRLHPASPAYELGFEPIPVEKIGVAGYRRPAGLP
ncbi:MAG: right-handed parallel beta-helix repeat-containing protein [Phycisphaerae bacterium]|nr:right-handed parallel beta-helix repeat-containing protein [Phycisphaerae bacterium]